MRCLATLLVAGLLAGAGCAGGDVPRDRYYRLEAGAPAAPLATPTLPGSLRVAPLRGDALTRGTALLYSDPASPSEVHRLAYEHWVDSPPAMLQRALTDFLREARVADRVLPAYASSQVDWVVSGRIRRLERIVSQAGSRAVLELELGLSRGSHREPLLQRRYREEHPVEKGVVGMDAALTALLQRFLDDLAALEPE